MEIRYSTTKTEIMKWYFNRWKKKLWQYHALLLLVILLAGAPSYLKGSASLGSYLGKSLTWGICAILFMIVYPILSHKSEERFLSIDEKGIQNQIGKKSASITWKKIESIEEINGSIYITGKNQNGFIVPSRAFSSNEIKSELFTYVKKSISA